MGMVTLHRDLLMAHEYCLGGGFYEFDYVNNRLILSGKSFDYGLPQWSKIDVLKVPAEYRGMGIVYRDYWGKEFDLVAEYSIQYY